MALGYNVNQLIQKLTSLAKQGLGDLPVMIDVSEPGGMAKIARAGMGMIGIASDGNKVLVIQQGRFTDVPVIGLNKPVMKGNTNGN